MGFNIAGIVINKKVDNEKYLKEIFNKAFEYKEEVDGEEALRTKDSSDFDLYATDKGTLIFFKIGKTYDFSNIKNEIIQFMISDVSDTFYFEKYNDRKVERKLIVSQGEVAENIGTGIINEDDDFMDVVLEYSNSLLNIDDVFDVNYKRFRKKGFLKNLLG